MRYYETIYIVDPNLENLVLDKTMDEISKELGKTESKLINHRVWGKKRLAYQIEKQKYGTYVLLQFEEGNQEKMVDFSTWMKLNNSIIRHMTVLLDVKPELYVEESKKEEPVANDGDTVVKEGVQKVKEKAQEIDSKPEEGK
jgi:small subunit ribosomal protein S6